MDEHAIRLTTHQAERLIARRDGIAKTLRDLADEVERSEPRIDLKTLGPSYSSMAHNIGHAITWGIANLGLTNFASDCAELDVLIASEGCS